MKLTDDEIVMVLRCAADRCEIGHPGGALQIASLALFPDDLPGWIVCFVADRCRELGIDVSLRSATGGSKHRRDALLEAAARIEEGR